MKLGTGSGDLRIAEAHGKPMKSGLPPRIVTSWASADRSPPLLDTSRFGNFFWQPVEGASISYRLYRPDILSGAADPPRRTGCPRQIAPRMHALLIAYHTAAFPKTGAGLPIPASRLGLRRILISRVQILRHRPRRTRPDSRTCTTEYLVKSVIRRSLSSGRFVGYHSSTSYEKTLFTKTTKMKIIAYLIAALLTMLHTSCYYRNHMPVTSSVVGSPRVSTMKVGERRKVMSKTILTEISPGVMMGPACQLKSSDPSIVKIDSNDMEPEAWVKAIAPGRADIQYIHHEGQITPILVIP